MSDPKKYASIVTSDSIAVVVEGKITTIQRSAANFLNLKKALETEDIAEIEKHLGISSSVENWAKGAFKVEGQNVLYKGETIPSELSQRMFDMASKGENPENLMNFWEKLQKNPSMRSVEQLYPFLKHQGIPILPNGNLLAYKGVKNNYTDQHSGTVDNKPGVVNRMPRNKVSDDPNTACHYGYHVGDLSYARSFAAITIVCEVNPEHVVCIPYDESQRKMRVCEYRVVGNHNGELLPSTSYELEKDIGSGGNIEPEKNEELAPPEKPEREEKKADVLQELNLAVTPEELETAKANKIQGIKAYRTRTGKGLKDSKDAIESALQQATEAAKAPVEKKLAKPRAEEQRTKLHVTKEWKKIHTMEMRNLLKEDIGTLREYAAKVLHIVGASKILGGKAALCARIVEVRENFQ